MRLYFIIFLSLLMLLNHSNTFSFSSIYSTYKHHDTIFVKGDHYYPPFEFINEKGDPDGFNVELFNALARVTGINYKLELAPWQQVRKELEEGEIDVLLGLMVSDERAKTMIFGVPHTVMTHGIFTRNNRVYKSIDELEGKEIIVQNKDRMHDYLIETGLTDKIITVKDQLSALELLSLGMHDAALIGNFQGMHLIKKHNLHNIKLQSSDIEPQNYSFAVSMGNEHLIWILNKGLFQLKTSGEYDKIYNKWFAVHENYSFIRNNLTLIFGVSVIVLILLFFVAAMQYQVKRITKKLRLKHNEALKLVENLRNEIAARKQTATALQYSENKFREIFNSTIETIIIHDYETSKILDCNATAITMFGYSNKEEMLSCSIFDLSSNNELYDYQTALNIINIAKKEGLIIVEWQSKKKNGEIFWTEITIKKAIIENENRILAFIRDINERKNSEEELLKAKEKAEESDRLKTAFLTNMSHEIRTPMNSIMGFASLLPDEKKPEILSLYSDLIVQNSEQLVHVIDDIVLYSKLQSKSLSSWPQTFSPTDLINVAFNKMNNYAESKKIKINIDIPKQNDIIFTSDPEKISQILINILSNAIKYSNEGEVFIGYEYNDTCVTYYIKDNGIGIAKDEHEKIFERFYRGRNIDPTKNGGTGLGLCIAKELAVLVNAEIYLKSTPGHGSVFYIDVPTI